MSKLNFTSWLPHLVAVIIFLLITIVYFSPILEGKRLAQHDIAQFKGMSQEINDYRERTGEEALWTNSMFSGMPAYQISVRYEGNLLRYFDQLLTFGIPRPFHIVMLYLLGFYFLLVTLKIDPRLAIAGAIAFAFSSYFFIILEAGHNSKAHAIGYVAPVIAGVLLTFRGKWLLGGAISALFLSLQFMANHLQITYYLLIILVLLGIFQFYKNYKENRLKEYFYALGVLLVAALFAVATNITSLWATYEYGQYTIRGPSELTSNDQSSGGLDKDYALGWSYGVAESMTLLVPDFMGGPTIGKLSEKSELYNTMVSQGVTPGQAKQIITQVPLYWGDQPVTSGPTYVGIIAVFLFVLALFLVKGPYKWWLFSAAVLGLLLSWGKNFMWFTDIFFEYVPLYNKFRAVSMTLVIVCVTVPFLAWLGLRQIEKGLIDKDSLIKYLKYSIGIVGGVLLLLVVFAGSFSYYGPVDEQLVNQYQWQAWMVEALRIDRASLLRMDALRGLFFVLASAGAIWLFVKEKLGKTAFVAILAGLILLDMWTVNKRYIDNDDFVAKSKAETPFQPTRADLQILQQELSLNNLPASTGQLEDSFEEYRSKTNFRVLNTTVSTFNDASTSYFHKSIGGYHGAKLRRYQELIERQISNNNMSVLNMLNTRYFITRGQDNQPVARKNPEALGNVWFVNNVQIVENADEEMEALTNFDPARTAVADKRFAGYLSDLDLSTTDLVLADTLTDPEIVDDIDRIQLTQYEPNHLVYTSNSREENLAVFSEIYYDKGWNAYIDGQPVDHIRVNYVLRALRVPPGQHTIEFKFEPQVISTGENISLASSALLIILVLGALLNEVRRKEGVELREGDEEKIVPVENARKRNKKRP